MRKAERIFTNICTTVGFIVLLGLTLGLLLFGCESKADTSGGERFERIYRDNDKHLDIIEDTETSCKYIFYNYTVGQAGAGGITPLLAKDGKPLCY